MSASARASLLRRVGAVASTSAPAAELLLGAGLRDAPTRSSPAGDAPARSRLASTLALGPDDPSRQRTARALPLRRALGLAAESPPARARVRDVAPHRTTIRPPLAFERGGGGGGGRRLSISSHAARASAADGGAESDAAAADSSESDASSDSSVPPHLARPSWLRRRENRKQKGSYEGFLTEIDTYDDFDPPGGSLYNIADFKAPTLESDEAALLRWHAEYVAHQKRLFEAAGGPKGLSDEAFLEAYEAEFALSEEEREQHILEWEVHMVHEAAGENDHPLNRKVSMRVRVKELQRETGLSDEAVEYVKEICGPRYNPKRNEIKITCARSRNREHNRQWCLTALYELIMEGNREFPSDAYRFSPEGPIEPQTARKETPSGIETEADSGDAQPEKEKETRA